MGGQSTAPGGLQSPPAWKGLRHGNTVHGLGLVPVTASFTGANLVTSASARAPIVFGGGDMGAFQVEVAYIRASATIAAHATDGVAISVRNTGADGTGTDNLSASAGHSTLSGADGAITAAETVKLTIDGPASSSPQNVYTLPSTAEGLEIYMAKLGAGVDLSAITFHVTLWLRLTAPNEG